MSRGTNLSGTIESPAEKATGSVMLLSGSGPQDRDESIAGHKPFRVLSNAVASWGYTVFRWDDRGVGQSDGDYLAASAEHLIDDVLSAMTALRHETGIDAHILVGHSQGTLIAASAAATRPRDVAGLILLAGMGVPGREGLLDQHTRICQAEGWSDDDIQVSLEQKKALFDILEDAQERINSGEPSALVLRDLRTTLCNAFLGDLDGSDLADDERYHMEEAVDDLMEWEWRYLLGADPASDLKRVQCPVLAVGGDQDSQVDAELNLAAMEESYALGNAPAFDTRVLANHNHLFQEAETGALSEYDSLGTPFSEELLSIVRSWLLRNLPQSEKGK